MINAYNLTKSFGDTDVLRGLYMNIKKGSIYGLAGRSGAGKSTMLRLINGLESYDSGSLIVDGVNVSSLSKTDMRVFRKKIGMIFQHFSLLERLNVYDNIALPLRCWKYKSGFIDRKVKELLELVGIPEKISQKPRQLSGGQKQRVAIARALTMEPHILLCDEATSALDPKTSEDVITLLKKINNRMGITIVVVTHQMSILRNVCREAAILENGCIAVSGPVDYVFSKKTEALENLLGSEVDEFFRTNPGTAALTLHEIRQDLSVSRMADELGIDITIAGMSGNSGGITIKFSNESLADVEKYLKKNNIRWSLYKEGYDNTDIKTEKAYHIAAGGCNWKIHLKKYQDK